MWRLGCEILHHHPNSKPEDVIDLYERMKNYGVKNFAKVSKMCMIKSTLSSGSSITWIQLFKVMCNTFVRFVMGP